MTRDYDTEISDTKDHQYAYNFDFDVMHPFMVRTFQPFLLPGKVLNWEVFKVTLQRGCCISATTLLVWRPWQRHC